MTPKEAHNILKQAVNAANLKGVYSLDDSGAILQALHILQPKEEIENPKIN